MSKVFMMEVKEEVLDQVAGGTLRFAMPSLVFNNQRTNSAVVNLSNMGITAPAYGGSQAGLNILITQGIGS